MKIEIRGLTESMDVFPSRKYMHSYLCILELKSDIVRICDNLDNMEIGAFTVRVYREELEKIGFESEDISFVAPISEERLRAAVAFLQKKDVKADPAELGMALCCQCGYFMPIDLMERRQDGRYECKEHGEEITKNALAEKRCSPNELPG